jgi:DNA adenine methylase
MATWSTSTGASVSIRTSCFLNSRQEFHDFRHQPGLTDLQRASRWFFRNKTCFGGASMDSFGTGAAGGGANNSRAARMESIRALNLRLDRVCIENLDGILYHSLLRAPF